MASTVLNLVYACLIVLISFVADLPMLGFQVEFVYGLPWVGCFTLALRGTVPFCEHSRGVIS